MSSAKTAIFIGLALLALRASADQTTAKNSDSDQSQVQEDVDAGSTERASETSTEKSSSDPCAAEVKRLDDRRAWLADRAKEQGKIGIPSAAAAVPNAAGLYCVKHPEDPQCNVSAPTSFEPDELSWSPGQSPVEFDPSIIGLKRALKVCRQKYGTGK